MCSCESRSQLLIMKTGTEDSSKNVENRLRRKLFDARRFTNPYTSEGSIGSINVVLCIISTNLSIPWANDTEVQRSLEARLRFSISDLILMIPMFSL
jgi:hypothetical protein